MYVDIDEFKEELERIFEKARYLALNEGKPNSPEERAYITVYYHLTQARRCLEELE